MARVTFDFDSDGYINIRGERYSALEIVNDAGQTALDWMLAQDNDELKNIANSWGLTPEKDDKTGAKKDDGVVDDPENEGNVDEAVDKSDTGGGLSNEEVTSIQERLNNLFGYKMKNNVVQKDSKGNPIIANQKAAIKITGGVEPKIQADGTVDIPGDVTINLVSDSKSMKSVDNGKFTIKFGRIDGNFICRGVKLSSLEGGPKFVKGTFDCGKNDLTSLTGSPEEVSIFIADQNPKLTSLVGGPKKINGMSDPTKDQRTDIYRVDSCGLTSLDGNGITLFGPGGFNCANNKITSLTGLSTITSVGVTKFNCSKNNLSSLNGIPKPRKDAKSGKPGDFDVSHNLSVTTFPPALADFEVNDFKANGLSLTSLSFAPKQVYGNFECTDNKSSTKITNQSIGKDRFKPTGFEEVTGNRIVKIDGDFVTNEGSWKDKTYDSNTVFKAATPTQTADGSKAPSSSGSVGGVEFISKQGKAEKIWLQKFNPSTLTGGYSTPKSSGTNPSGKAKYGFAGKGPSGWVSAGYKNFINAGPFEDGTNPTWASGSPNGLFVVNGNNYGSKVDGGSTDIHPKNSDMRFLPLVVISPYKDIISGKYDVQAEKGGVTLLDKKGLGNIKIAIPMYNICISNNKVNSVHKSFSAYASWPFIGILGSGMWFAGAASIVDNKRDIVNSWNIPEIATEVLAFWNKKNETVKKMAGGDGGGSTKLVINGQQVAGHSQQRSVPTILAW